MRVVFFVFFILAGCASPLDDQGSIAPDCETGVEIGECLPTFTLPDRSGSHMSLGDFTHRVVVAFLFSGW
jgi:cytochrome oxidase Cu insertion factor (SCO1/SenC/PrrC family)